MLIVGGNDELVIDLNVQALRLLHCTRELFIVPGETHLFAEPGALEEVARLAKEWFVRHLDPARELPAMNELGARFPHADMDKEC